MAREVNAEGLPGSDNERPLVLSWENKIPNVVTVIKKEKKKKLLLFASKLEPQTLKAHDILAMPFSVCSFVESEEVLKRGQRKKQEQRQSKLNF